ncbi:hypothetical protein O6H91_07G020600 [Diphasiastrum complanatum]|uniref:Uncharacterized protein n=1 Tax=Diphasiastrum complanatum TaxID=34168 RepID=A0ACC2D336_DIPCM|nr:hypothetical protein O6H91_07G020600 [Diphasiastrum complanatum]
MDVEIGKDAVKVLSQCSSMLDEMKFEALAQAGCSLILDKERSEETYLGPLLDKDTNVELVKDVCSTLACLFLEAAKNDVSLESLALFLRSRCSFLDKKATTIAGIFADRKAELRAHLSATANHSYFYKLSGVEWKLDYCVSSSEDRTLKEFLYHICLKKWISEAEQEDDTAIQFVCSEEELQDLVSRLKDACKSVERAGEHH